MKTEQKLQKLLQIAVENGWYSDIYNEIKNGKYKLYSNQAHWFSSIEGLISINDLVTNFEEGQISFIEALYNASKFDSDKEFFESNLGREITEAIDESCLTNFTEQHILVHRWNFYFDNEYKIECRRPTSQRLDWLLRTFEHLL